MAGQTAIGALRVSLGIDTAQFTTGLKQAQGRLAGFGKLAGISFAGAAVAAAAAGVAISVAVKGSIDSAEAMGELAQKVGVGVEALSGLSYAAKLSGVSTDQLGIGLKKLGVNMDAVAHGGAKPAAEAFGRLGISVTDASGKLRDSDQVLVDVAGKFAGMKDGAAKTAIAVALFGKAGSDLIPLLNEGKTGIEAMRTEAAALGIVIDTKTAKAADGFNDNLDRLKAVGSGVTTQLAAGMLPAMQDISGALVGVAKNTKVMSAVGALLGGVLKTLATAGVIVGAVFATLGGAVGVTAKALFQVAQGQFAEAFATIKSGAVSGVEGIKAAVSTVQAIWTQSAAAVKADSPKTSEGLADPAVETAKKVKAARQEIESEADKARKAADEFLAAGARDLGGRGFSGDQVKAQEAFAKAGEFVTAGLIYQAAAAAHLAGAYQDLADVQSGVARDSVVFVATIDDLNDSFKKLETDSRTPLEKITDDFYGMAQAIDDVFRGVGGNDWVGALNGITRAVGQLKTAFSAAGTQADKFAAVAGIASAAGSAIGGVGGAGISGAASGALAGFTLGGPVGAAVGAVLGGLGGILGASKAKKRAKAEAAERARLEAERKAAEEAATKRALEIRLMELGGDAAGARAAVEADLLKTLSPANAELQKQVFLQERAADLVAQQRALEQQLLEASGQSAEALVRFREDGLAALPPQLRALQQSIYDVVDATQAAEAANARVDEARGALSDAYDRESTALEGVRDRFAALADTLSEFRAELVKTALEADPRRALAGARAEFLRVANAARLGDASALSALPDVGRALVDASKAFSPTAGGFGADLAKVRQAVTASEGVARRAADSAAAQLDALKAEVGDRLTLNTSVLSVRQAIIDLQAAITSQTSAANLSFDAGAAAKALDVAARTLPIPADATLAEDLTAGLTPLLLRIVANTGLTAAQLDDVIRGGLAINTVAA